ncbi:Pentatricopeptide repeat-containing protein [Arachis hypogaea]|nr:Pentatricopeptide repeat-containing protein [Arachis hypogaea]
MYRRVLHRSLCTATQSATTSSAASTTSIKAISQDLYKESNFRLLVEKFKKASDLERFRKKTGIYEDTVRRLASAKRFSCVRNILDHQKKYPEIDKEGFCSRIITLYGKSRMYRHARKLFDEMPQRNCTRTVLSFNALLAAYLHSRKFDLVHTLFKELPKELSVEPNLVSYNTLIKALCESGSFDSGLEMLDEMEKKGVKPDLITFNTLLDALYANGRFEDGEKLWVSKRGKGIAPDIRTCNSRLMGLALEKKTKEAVEFIEEMKKDAKKWFGEIGKSEFDPHKVTYATLVPFLCEKGDLKTAHEVSKDIFNHRLRVDGSLLQLVVDKLVAESMVSEAEEIVELGKANKYCRYKLNLPGPAEEKKSE